MEWSSTGFYTFALVEEMAQLLAVSVEEHTLVEERRIACDFVVNIGVDSLYAMCKVLLNYDLPNN
eukprot:8371543-Prorocentrum_lima.AAC.1